MDNFFLYHILCSSIIVYCSRAIEQLDADKKQTNLYLLFLATLTFNALIKALFASYWLIAISRYQNIN